MNKKLISLVMLVSLLALSLILFGCDTGGGGGGDDNNNNGDDKTTPSSYNLTAMSGNDLYDIEIVTTTAARAAAPIGTYNYKVYEQTEGGPNIINEGTVTITGTTAQTFSFTYTGGNFELSVNNAASTPTVTLSGTVTIPKKGGGSVTINTVAVEQKGNDNANVLAKFEGTWTLQNPGNHEYSSYTILVRGSSYTTNELFQNGYRYSETGTFSYADLGSNRYAFIVNSPSNGKFSMRAGLSNNDKTMTWTSTIWTYLDGSVWTKP